MCSGVGRGQGTTVVLTSGQLEQGRDDVAKVEAVNADVSEKDGQQDGDWVATVGLTVVRAVSPGSGLRQDFGHVSHLATSGGSWTWSRGRGRNSVLIVKVIVVQTHDG